MDEPHIAALASDSLARLREQFNVLADLSPDAAAAWLDANVTDAHERLALERLLALDSSEGGYLDTPMGEQLARLKIDESALPENLIGQSIGAFRLTRLLGKGGMAAVFLGEREGDDFRQQVAVKLLRRGLFSELEQRLFRRERQLLASLDHPNIAHLIDGGITEPGIPYLVIEFVDGLSITQYATERKLDIRQRLDLMLVVCRAIEAAHRALIVHRDIKPANVLVSNEGIVKVLDFGIAKLLEEEGETATFGIFTPDYAAPEQVAGKPITTATDVYGLGVLMHELLLGVRPQSHPPRRPSSVVADTDTLRLTPTQLSRALRGDLDTILMKALAAEPEQRYTSAATFADDIERFLRGQPVAAHPPTRLYRTKKFIQRHRGGFLVTTALVVAIFAALGLTLWQASVARQEAARASAMRDFIFTAFEEAQPSTPRSGPPKITEVVEQAMVKARDATGSNPRVYTELQTKLGAVLRAQGNLPAARSYLQQNYEQARATLGENDSLALDAGTEWLGARIQAGDLGDNPAARKLADELLARIPAQTSSLRTKILMGSALLAIRQGNSQRALLESGEALQMARKLDNESILASALTMSAVARIDAKDFAGAAKSAEELLAVESAELGSRHVRVALAHAGLARIYRMVGDLDRGEEHMRAALAIDEAVLSKDDYRRANHLNALMMLQRSRRDYAGALESATEALRIDRLVLGPDQPETNNDLNAVGMMNFYLGNFPTATATLHEALQGFEKNYGNEHGKTAHIRANYGLALAAGGNLASGEAELQHAIQSQSLPNASAGDVDMRLDHSAMLATVLLDHHDFAAALPIIDAMDASLANRAKPDFNRNANAATLRASASLLAGQLDQARQSLDAAEKDLKQSPDPDRELQIEIPLLQAAVAVKLGDMDNAKTYFVTGSNALMTLRNPPFRLNKLADTISRTTNPAK